MKAARYILAAILMLAGCRASLAMTDTMTGIFTDRMRTLQVTDLAGSIFTVPYVTLGTAEQLVVSFDELAEDRSYLRYRVLRCDADWRPSSLAESEYLDGFNESVIEDYDFSRATTVHYVHYSFAFPNADISPRLSGNYLIQVYGEDDPSETLLQVRVMVSEQTADISGEMTSRTDVDYNDAHQQLSLRINTEHAHVADPFNDLTVVISQNGRADSERALRHPLRMSGPTAVYEHQQPLIFEAGNEYRRFEISDVRYPGMGVEDIEYMPPYYHFTLATDASRAGQGYLYDQTQHGRFKVREYNSSQSDVEADYAVVHFSLDYPEMDGMSIFLDGDFTQRRFDPASLMTFNRATGRYEKAVLLKQGAYNYQYLAVPPGARSGKTSVIEGDKYQTVNEYLVKVYTRGPLDRTDRLIGVRLMSNVQ